MAVARALLEMLIGAPQRQQPRTKPEQPKAAEQALFRHPSNSHWALPSSNSACDSCILGQQGAGQSQYQGLQQSVTQLSFALREGSRPAQRQQASDTAQHRQTPPLQWRYDQNYSSKMQKSKHGAPDSEKSSPSQEVQLSCSEEVDMDDFDMQSCGVSKLRLGSSHSEEDLHADSATEWPDSSNADSADKCSQSITANLQHNRQDRLPLLQEQSVHTVSQYVKPGSQQQIAALEDPMMQVEQSRLEGCGPQHDMSCNDRSVLACGLASATQHVPALPNLKLSNGKRLPHSWQALSEEMAVSPTHAHEARLKRMKPNQVRKLKF